MSAPKVLDAKGRELEMGSRLKHRRPTAPDWRGEMTVEKIGHSFTSAHLRVRRASGCPLLLLAVAPAEPGLPYRCPDLLLITDDEKGDGSNAVHNH